MYDWGLYNKIGHDSAGIWRTLSLNEWQFVFERRIDASNLHFLAIVNNEEGCVILPDNWNNFDNIYLTDSLYSMNIYRDEDWKQMENNGAVFLRCTNIYGKDTIGRYWSTTTGHIYKFEDSTYWSRPLIYVFGNKGFQTHLGFIDDICNVRLVKDLK